MGCVHIGLCVLGVVVTGRFLFTDSISLVVIGLFKFLMFWWNTLRSLVFLGNFPFLTPLNVCWPKVVHSIPLCFLNLLIYLVVCSYFHSWYCLFGPFVFIFGPYFQSFIYRIWLFKKKKKNNFLLLLSVSFSFSFISVFIFISFFFTFFCFILLFFF